MKTGSGIPPWHLWGGTISFNPQPFGSVAVQQQVTQQIARVAYKRPDSWHWLFTASLLQGPTAGALDLYALQVDFDLTIGIGRAQYTMKAFETFQWVWSDRPAPLDQRRYSTQAVSPPRLVAQTAPFLEIEESRLPITQIVGQDIQCTATVTGVGSDQTQTAVVEVSAFFAPRTHVRPEWVLHHFPGGEQ